MKSSNSLYEVLARNIPETRIGEPFHRGAEIRVMFAQDFVFDANECFRLGIEEVDWRRNRRVDKGTVLRFLIWSNRSVTVNLEKYSEDAKTVYKVYAYTDEGCVELLS